MDFDQELKLTFDSLRNSGLAASLAVAAAFTANNPEFAFGYAALVISTVLILYFSSLFLQGANCVSYLRQVSVRSKSGKKYFLYLGAAVYTYMMLILYSSIAAKGIEALMNIT